MKQCLSSSVTHFQLVIVILIHTCDARDHSSYAIKDKHFLIRMKMPVAVFRV